MKLHVKLIISATYLWMHYIFPFKGSIWKDRLQHKISVSKRVSHNIQCQQSLYNIYTSLSATAHLFTQPFQTISTKQMLVKMPNTGSNLRAHLPMTPITKIAPWTISTFYFSAFRFPNRQNYHITFTQNVSDKWLKS